MLRGADIHSDSIILHCETAEDLQAFEGLTGIDPHCFHFWQKGTGRGPLPMQVSYHIPENGQAVSREITNKILGTPQQGETEYRIELRLPSKASTTARALPAPEARTPSKFFFEDITDLARALGKGRRDAQGNLIEASHYGHTPLITEAQENELVQLARDASDLEAAHTLFFPNRHAPRFMVETDHGDMCVGFNKTHPDYHKAEADAAYKAVYATKVQDYMDTETLQEAAGALVAHGMLSEEQRPQFMHDVRAMRLRQKAIANLEYARTGVATARHSPAQLDTSRRYVEIMRTLAETGDVSRLSLEDLESMHHIGQGTASVYDFVQIAGRAGVFEKICQDYLPEIETAIATPSVDATLTATQKLMGLVKPTGRANGRDEHGQLLNNGASYRG
ncbi:MAG: hypothetical protein V4735_08420 [Pseudomonadota bacterium]